MSIRRPADDDLERLLSQAEWPELQSPETTAAVERLSRAWQELRRVEPARRSGALGSKWISVGAAAASIAVLVAGVLWWNVPTREPVAERLPAEQPTIDSASTAKPNPNPTPVAVKGPEQLVREPNTYERLVLQSQARAKTEQIPAAIEAYLAEREIGTDAKARGASGEDLALDRLLAGGSPRAAAQFLSLLAEPTSQKAALAALKRAKSPPIDGIAAFLDDPRRPVRLAAAHALSTLDDPLAVERLSQSVAGIGRQEALMALLASRSPRASELIDAARRDVYLMASVHAAEQQLLTLQTENGENLP